MTIQNNLIFAILYCHANISCIKKLFMLKSIKSYTIHKLVEIRHTLTELVLVEVFEISRYSQSCLSMFVISAEEVRDKVKI